MYMHVPEAKYLSLYVIMIHSYIIKPGAHRPQAGAPGFLELFLCGHQYVCVCVCLCVRPRGYE